MKIDSGNWHAASIISSSAGRLLSTVTNKLYNHWHADDNKELGSGIDKEHMIYLSIYLNNYAWVYLNHQCWV